MKPRVLRRGRRLALHCVRRFLELCFFRSLRKLIDYFVTDDKDLCMFAYERGSLAKLSQVVNSITPADRSPTWEEEESEHISSLREVRSRVLRNFIPLTHLSYDRQLSVRSQPCHCGIMISVGRLLRTIP